MNTETQNIRVEIIAIHPQERELLMGAVKWLRQIEERRDQMPGGMFRHGTDPTPLRRKIDALLN